MSPTNWENSTKSFNRRFWMIWLVALIIVFLIHLTTLTISSLAWIDEVQTLEYGRLTFEPNSNWSLNWSVRLDRPLFLLSYLGPSLQEIAFRISNLSLVGPRVASLLGGMIAATTFLGYLLFRKTPKSVAWLLALIFLLEPMVVHSYRGARVDSWAFALCFGCCWLLRLAIQRIQTGQISTWLVTGAGSLAATAIFVWPSTVLLYPLIGVELIELIWQSKVSNKSWQIAIRHTIAFVLGGTITAGLLVIPIWQQLSDSLGDLKVISSNDRTFRSHSGLLPEIQKMLSDVIDTYRIDPLLPIAALLGIILSRDKKLIFSTLIVTVFVLSSRFYTFRAVYLLPYFLCLLASAYQALKNTSKLTHRRIISVILIFLISWNLVLSLFVRPVTALREKEGRNPNILYDAGVSLVGAGSHKVSVNAIELYYAGRSLGWKMFFPFDMLDGLYGNVNNVVDEAAFQRFISNIDFAIISSNQLSPKMINRMEAVGLKYQKKYESGHTSDINLKEKEGDKSKINQAVPYGYYVLYSR